MSISPTSFAYSKAGMAAILALALVGAAEAENYYFYGSDVTLGANTGWWGRDRISNDWLDNYYPFLTEAGNWTNWTATMADAANWTAVFSGAEGTVTVNTGKAAAIYVGGLDFTVADYTLSGGTLNLVGAGSTAPTITTAVGNTAIVSVLAGTDGLTKNGAGQLTLTGNNSYTGTTTVSGGTLVLARNKGTLADTSDLDIRGGSTLQLESSDTVRKVTLTDGTIAGATLTAASVELRNGIVDAALGGNGITITKTTSGTVTLTAENTFSGTVSVDSGKLVLAHEAYPGALNNDGVSVNVNGGTLSLTYNETVADFKLTSGSVVNETSAVRRLTSNSRIDVRSGTIDAFLNGTRGLTKTTAGTVVLNGANTYTGTTQVDGGTLRIGGSGSLAVGTAVTVASGATLSNAGMIAGAVTVNSGGSLFNDGGTIGGSVDVAGSLYGTGRVGAVTLADGGTIGAGNNGDIGTLDTGALTLNGDTYYFFDFEADGSSDRLEIDGGLTLGMAASVSVLLNSSTFDGGTDGQWTLLDTTADLSGLNLASFTMQDGNLPSYAGTFSIGLNALDSSELMLTYTAIPEPQTYALFFGVGTLGMVVLRRWRARRS